MNTPIHTTRRIVDGPNEWAHPAHWTAAVSMGTYCFRPEQAGASEQLSGDFAINLPTHGAYLCGRGRRARVVDASQVALFARDRAYATRPNKEGHSGLYLRLHPSIVEELRRAMGAADHTNWSRITRLDAHTRRDWYALWGAVQRGLDDEALYEGAVGLADQILTTLPQPRTPPPVSSTALEWVRAIQLHLAQTPGTRETLDQLADRVHWSRFSLCRAFRKRTGRSIHQHRESLRMACAANQLQDRPNLTDLAFRLGYSSHSHFTARFRQHYGVVPRDWVQEGRTDLTAHPRDPR